MPIENEELISHDFDVFVSYSSKDKVIADAVVTGIEQAGIRCWYAPRDVEPGADWADSITKAIHQCKIMVLVFSKHANRSQRVIDEINYAINQEKLILPFRIEPHNPTGALSLHLSSRHWLDAYDPSWEDHIDRLIHSVEINLDTTKKEVQISGEQASATVDEKKGDKFPFLPKIGSLAGGILILVVLVYFGWYIFRKSGSSRLETTPEVIEDEVVSTHISDTEKTSAFEASKATAVAGTQIALRAVETEIAQSTQRAKERVTETPVPSDTPTPSPTPTPELGATRVSPVDNMTQIYIPAGEFLMGPTASEIEDKGLELCDYYGIWYYSGESNELVQSKVQECIKRGKSEFYQHAVYLDSYWIDQREVTNQMFADFLNEEGNQQEKGASWLDEGDNTTRIINEDGTWIVTPGFGDKYVREVSWYGARAYCEWAGRSLPTEAEWEKAAQQIGYELTGMFERPKEWVADWYDMGFYYDSPYENPPGPDSGNRKITRGDGVYFRNQYDPDRSVYNIGFRCVEVVTPESQDSD